MTEELTCVDVDGVGVSLRYGDDAIADIDLLTPFVDEGRCL